MSSVFANYLAPHLQVWSQKCVWWTDLNHDLCFLNPCFLLSAISASSNVHSAFLWLSLHSLRKIREKIETDYSRQKSSFSVRDYHLWYIWFINLKKLKQFYFSLFFISDLLIIRKWWFILSNDISLGRSLAYWLKVQTGIKKPKIFNEIFILE